MVPLVPALVVDAARLLVTGYQAHRVAVVALGLFEVGDPHVHVAQTQDTHFRLPCRTTANAVTVLLRWLVADGCSCTNGSVGGGSNFSLEAARSPGPEGPPAGRRAGSRDRSPETPHPTYTAGTAVEQHLDAAHDVSDRWSDVSDWGASLRSSGCREVESWAVVVASALTRNVAVRVPLRAAALGREYCHAAPPECSGPAEVRRAWWARVPERGPADDARLHQLRVGGCRGR